MYNFATKIVRDTSRHYCRHSLNNYDVYGIFIGDETLENLTYGLTTYDLSYGCKGFDGNPNNRNNNNNRPRNNNNNNNNNNGGNNGNGQQQRPHKNPPKRPMPPPDKQVKHPLPPEGES